MSMRQRLLTGGLIVSTLSGCVTNSTVAASGSVNRTCAATSPARTPAFHPARIESLRAALDEMVERGIAPGAVMIVEQDGEIVFDHVTGLADKEDGKVLEADALFRLYSMTKPITSVVALQLVDEGTFSLDDPVAKFIPEFDGASVRGANGSPVSLERPITIADLLSHQAGMVYSVGSDTPTAMAYAQAGIPAGPGVEPEPQDGSAAVTTLPDLARRVASVPLADQPGGRFVYGNASDILGRVIEVALDKPLPAVFAQRVFEPLGMEDTGFRVLPSNSARLTSAYIAPEQFATEYRGVLSAAPPDRLQAASLSKIDDDEKSFFLKEPEIAYGGAGLAGSAHDYLKFAQALRRDVSDGREVLLSKKSAIALSDNQLSSASMAKSEMLGQLGFGYGVAIKLTETDARPVFPQCGLFWAGAASTYFWIDPDGRTSGVMMTQVFGGNVRSYWLEILEEIYGG